MREDKSKTLNTKFLAFSDLYFKNYQANIQGTAGNKNAFVLHQKLIQYLIRFSILII
jgi:hypothetical protein